MTRSLAALACIWSAAWLVAAGDPVSAHRTAVSPYTFHKDIAPILEARCGSCHGEGNVSGLSLFRYDSARAATWLIQQRLIRGHMPPWFAIGPFVAPAPMTPRELNMLMTWTTGGAPEGKPIERPRRASAAPWPLGTPDVIAPMPSAITVPADPADRIHEVELPAARIGGRTIRAVDLLPGTPSAVRSAELIARDGDRDQVIGLWQPGDLASRFAIDAGFRAPRSARLVARIRYRHRFGAPVSDKSAVAIYFGDRSAAAIRTLEFNPGDTRPDIRDFPSNLRVVSIRPVGGPSGAIAVITLVSPDGSRRELARLRLQPDWVRRYVLETPVALPARHKIEVSSIPSVAHFWSSLTSEPDGAGDTPVRIAIEVID
jgi:hypothetical protein